MSFTSPNIPNHLPPPLQRIAVSTMKNRQFRILYKQDGEWTVWRGFDLKAMRDNVFRKEAQKHPEIVFAMQEYDKPVHGVTR